MNNTTIHCPHCTEKIHLIDPKSEIRVNKSYHEPNCEVCGEYNHYTKDHQAYEDARAVAS